MKHIKYIITILLCALPLFASLPLLTSCLDDDSLEHADTHQGSFEALWQTLDQHYCFFSEKGVDWDAQYRRFKPMADTCHSQYFLLDSIMDPMLDMLKDGHTNVYTSFNTARYWEWYENYDINYDADLVRKYYLGTNYQTVSGISYGMFSRDTVAYMRYASFASAAGETNIDYVLGRLRNCRGLIIDVRGNGGGMLSNVPVIANRFVKQKTLYGYIYHKTGPGHNDFSRPEPMYLEPSDRISWDAEKQPVIILANRGSYSATNNFVQAMKCIPGVLVFGDRTGGGGGMPFQSVLPNGWTVRFSACPITDRDHKSVEAGIDPDHYIKLDSLLAFNEHRDCIIDSARAYIFKNTRIIYKDKDKNEEK